MDKPFYISQGELRLKFSHGSGKRMLSFGNAKLRPNEWRVQCKQKLSELLGLQLPLVARNVGELRRRVIDGITVVALIMDVSEEMSIPGYLLLPEKPASDHKAVIAIHGHGTVEPCIGSSDDYHHSFALQLAKNGHIVLCPELRGFGTLKDVALHSKSRRLDYWNWGNTMAYSLVSDGVIHAKPLIGETVEDLLRWEDWLASNKNIKTIDVAGISYGGDLALIYPVFSSRVDRIFASGTLGSFSVIFSHCYNAPAHAIPGVLLWMDRSDIAGLNAPRPLAIHYGELDKPGPYNFSASYNQTVPKSLEELKRIYRMFGAENQVSLVVSPGKKHEMDNDLLIEFLKPKNMGGQGAALDADKRRN